ncbi:hypothetical protein COT62_00075 [Candidatus Roizmanbacteria bacterium CG09_land_8_20_14_0_10_41_9]|uniref:Uncharacterized protein n=1 Tax=Candidatus Roizmanbacteria bacterium CG09_land_8_20_14_0_10_41_9 TaxID=1974850 RepID=A0A2H0WU24_9BACT|nr:MAG: hypothetical protein COT62_00075 [Candidatus Roizmanbacteria bacterium CG09_land_8_20_14_0_10_41_9]
MGIERLPGLRGPCKAYKTCFLESEIREGNSNLDSQALETRIEEIIKAECHNCRGIGAVRKLLKENYPA